MEQHQIELLRQMCSSARPLTRREQSAECVREGSTKSDQGDFAGAFECAKRAIELDTGNADAYLLAATSCISQYRYAEALGFARTVLASAPEQPLALTIKALALWSFGQERESLTDLRRALAYARRAKGAAGLVAVIHSTLGRFMYDSEAPTEAELADAEQHLREAHRMNPAAHPYHRFFRGTWMLKRGCYSREAWQCFEDRAVHGYMNPCGTPATRTWDGSPISGTLLVDCTQGGLGDTIQWGRYLSMSRARVGRLVVVVDQRSRRLIPLLESCPAVDAIATDLDRLPAYDAVMPLVSASHVFGTTLESIPEARWLREPPQHNRDAARTRTGPSGFKIGLAWAASEGIRSLPLSALAALATVPGVRLFGFQRGPEAGELDGAAFPVTNLERPDTDVMDTAAAMLEMDLVISADTMTAHLAGSLGVKTFVLLPWQCDWRWLLDRSDSPWYPDTVRLFRQTVAGDWAGPVAAIVEAVRALARQ